MTDHAFNGNEDIFVQQLTAKLNTLRNVQLEKSTAEDGPDLKVVNHHSGKQLFIEFKNAKEYGELPISSILPIAKLAKQNGKTQKILLVSFSHLSDLLSSKLKELNVQALTQPTVDQVVEQVRMALA